MTIADIAFVPNDAHLAFVRDFLDPACPLPKYIMGTSRDGYALDVCKLVKIDGFIDDFSDAVSHASMPVVKSEQVAKHALILVCSTVRTVSAVASLRERGFVRVLDYPGFFLHARHASLRQRIIESFGDEFARNTRKFEWLAKRLHDAKSKDILNSLAAYRLTAELRLMSGFRYLPKEQYFPEFVDLDEEVFVDVGGYDGDTTLELVRRCPNYRGAYVFEPSSANVDLARKKLSGLANIRIIDKGVSDAPATLRFSSHEGAASKVSAAGDQVISVDTLDSLVDARVSFIKMDIEGGEARAIEGARGHILNDHPKMAIAVYHKPGDLWDIAEQVLAIRDDYDLYLRHYTEGVDETVMYFMPRAH